MKKYKDILKYLHYCANTAQLTLTKDNKSKRLIPDEDNNIVFTLDSIKYKIKYTKLIWYIVYNTEVDNTHIIWHKDLDTSNYKLNNLCLITKEEYKKIQEALQNLSGILKIKPHKSDAFTYVLEYKEQGRIRKENIEDVSLAAKKLKKLKFKYTKLVSRYVLTK